MPRVLKDNAYHVLGLDASASQKDVLKRSKEIINRLKINDYPEYNFDIGLFKNFRTEESVKEAVQKLQFPKKRIKEYFFWFQIADDTDKRAQELLKKKDYKNAIHVWQIAANSNSPEDILYKKNLVILYCLLLSEKNSRDYLRDSLSIWKELIGSSEFWASFSKTYDLHADQNGSQEIIDEFKKDIVNELSDLYADLHQTHKSASFINEFQKVFSARGEKVAKDILGPAFQTINYAVESLTKIKISKDGVFNKEEHETIKTLIKSIQAELNKLIEFGLYDDSQTKVMRDKVAEAFRIITLDLHNNLDETKEAISILNIALKIVGTSSLRTQMQHDLKTLKTFQEQYGKPLKDTPTLFTFNGIGTKIYGDTLYFVFLYFPIIPLARYALEEHGNSYSFFRKLTLRKWQKMWIVLLALFFSWAIFFNSGNVNHGSANQAHDVSHQSDGSGKYRCSKNDISKADSMKPNDFMQQQLEAEQKRLENQASQIKALAYKINNADVDQTDQYSIDSYNNLINKHNSKLEKYQRDAKRFDMKVDEYETQIKKYNSFLEANCTGAQ